MNVPEEVPDDGLENIPANEDVNELVTDVAQTDGSGELVDEANGADDDAGCGQTLGTHGRLEGFGRNDTLQGRVGEGVDNIEEKVRSQRALFVRDLQVRGLVGECGGETRVDSQADRASYSGTRVSGTALITK